MARAAVSAAILAGGRNTRMKNHKAFLAFDGCPIIQRTLNGLYSVFDEVLVIANEMDRYAHLDARVLPDVIPHQGPLSGIHAALTHAVNPYVFVVACDMPFINVRVAEFLVAHAEGYECVVPVIRSYPEPLYAVYGKSCLPKVQDFLSTGRRRVVDLFSTVRVNYISESEIRDLGEPEKIFFNVNYPEDWARVRKIVQKTEASDTDNANGKTPPVVCVVGTSDSGKTMLVTRIVSELKHMGFRVGTVKHAPHGADLDVPGKDSWKHAQAGAEVSAVVSPQGVALFRAREAESSLEEVVAQFRGADLALVEGYKYLSYPKILVSTGKSWKGNAEGVFAVAGSAPPGMELPSFDRDDAAGLARAIVERLGLEGRQSTGESE